jgi:hypothetical protein
VTLDELDDFVTDAIEALTKISDRACYTTGWNDSCDHGCEEVANDVLKKYKLGIYSDGD